MRLPALLLALAVSGCTSAAPVVSSPTPTIAPTASAMPTPAPPRVVSTTASEALVTITYDRPMKHGLSCGQQGFSAGLANTIDAYEMNITSRYYGSTDPVFDEFWSKMWVASLNADCSAVTFTFVHGMGPGMYPLSITKVQDLSGRPLAQDPTVVVVTILETAPPRMQLVQQYQDTATFQFSEPIKKALATDITRYRFDGASLPAGSTVACGLTCAVTTVALPAFRAHPPKTVSVIGFEDLSGKSFVSGTETRDIDLMQGQ